MFLLLKKNIFKFVFTTYACSVCSKIMENLFTYRSKNFSNFCFYRRIRRTTFYLENKLVPYPCLLSFRIYLTLFYFAQNFRRLFSPVNSISTYGMLTLSHLLGKKVKPRWPPMERNFAHQFQSSARSSTSVSVLYATLIFSFCLVWLRKHSQP